MSKLTHKEKKFADTYIETGNGTKSALIAYNTDKENTAGSIASENLTKPRIIAYLEENAVNAMSRIVDLSINAETETVKLNANRDIVDRAGYKAIDRSVSVNANLNIETNPKAQALADKYEEEFINILNET